MVRPKTDPARFEVVKNALFAAAEEMKIVLAKTAYSPLLKVAGDYSCGIFDVDGNMVAQGPDLPIHLGSMPDAVRAVVRAFPRPLVGGEKSHAENETDHEGLGEPPAGAVLPGLFQCRLDGGDGYNAFEAPEPLRRGLLLGDLRDFLADPEHRSLLAGKGVASISILAGISIFSCAG